MDQGSRILKRTAGFLSFLLSGVFVPEERLWEMPPRCGNVMKIRLSGVGVNQDCLLPIPVDPKYLITRPLNTGSPSMQVDWPSRRVLGFLVT